ncbi:circadian clock protein KaiC [Ohtaekwangia koreensis]|uniref:non-specific serine/threonine protein kinase n=1 Tax=Ohtaekwangia koreensis TaxID=688867 RepID=A0A1T5LNS3_9BACT|nr:circadian clock protein KaiC [Ohtaekwangia koreensis]SKC77561.1 circadian clock protein KaiC [Ohtaekwangia koreensis]
MRKGRKSKVTKFKFLKSLTGIQGLDDITTGGLPKNRPTLLLGNTGCGKTIMAMEFLVNGITRYNEPGVFMAFEEKADELIVNVKSLGYDLDEYVAKKSMYLEHVRVDSNEKLATGKYDIEGLFVRLGHAIDKIKAKRVVLDSLDTLFYGFDYAILRSEFKRLFSWLKEKNVTAIITAEIGDAFLTRHGLEEYVADCVILLDNRVTNQITTRRLRVVKYRGSLHGNNEYPFIIDEKGITVFPIIAEALQQKSSTRRISSGIKNLDEMLGKKGFFEGSSILISGTAGTGKTSIAAAFVYSACQENRRCLFCAFEEAPNQIIRNMQSIGFSLKPLVESEMLTFYYSRPTLQNLELHFIAIKKLINEIRPAVVVLDPITNLMTEGPNSDIRSMLTRFVDFLKTQHITVMFTAAITVGSIERNPSDEGISSMVDTWMMVQDIEVDAERTRSLCVMKSRGMPHSNEVKKFIISNKGIKLNPIATGKTDSKRVAKENQNLLPQNNL